MAFFIVKLVSFFAVAEASEVFGFTVRSEPGQDLPHEPHMEEHIHPDDVVHQAADVEIYDGDEGPAIDLSQKLPATTYATSLDTSDHEPHQPDIMAHVEEPMHPGDVVHQAADVEMYDGDYGPAIDLSKKLPATTYVTSLDTPKHAPRQPQAVVVDAAGGHQQTVRSQ
eukprot:gnl/MRDRNA2_/MRDRNA2_29868_c0_seq1.p1 gnl/MRDRNA2_/MRDRNA2_29868_c0~~gnl/MRDRNA2_/MRDRNA2_29868_c0_seq1.p1  ORF type:complete len:168 (+),score=38.51 gnl/MRDRNA2_/MRDRNA2_29868_c0_seq1:126-629(+)